MAGFVAFDCCSPAAVIIDLTWESHRQLAIVAYLTSTSYAIVEFGTIVGDPMRLSSHR